MTQTKFHKFFSPVIAECRVPNKFVDIINKTADDVLSDDKKSIQWDWSHKLVGKVHKEIQIPVTSKSEKQYLSKIVKEACLEYLLNAIEENRAHKWYKLASKETKPTIDNIHLTQSWVVSQYAGDFNPWHHHTGDFSAVIYLKVPQHMDEEISEELKDHYPAKGLIEFSFGEALDFRNDNVKFMPKVGRMLIFPSYLKHFVYPFSCEGERRSMSFNASLMVKK